MNIPALHTLIDTNVTQQAPTDRIVGAEVRQVDHAITDEIAVRGMLNGVDTGNLSLYTRGETGHVLIPDNGIYIPYQTASPADNVNTFPSGEAGWLWKKAVNGGPSQNFANADLTLSGNRTHMLNGKKLEIKNGTTSHLLIDPTPGAAIYQFGDSTAANGMLMKFHEYPGGNRMEWSMWGQTIIRFNDGTSVLYLGDVDSTISKILLTVDQDHKGVKIWDDNVMKVQYESSGQFFKVNNGASILAICSTAGQEFDSTGRGATVQIVSNSAYGTNGFIALRMTTATNGVAGGGVNVDYYLTYGANASQKVAVASGVRMANRTYTAVAGDGITNSQGAQERIYIGTVTANTVPMIFTWFTGAQCAADNDVKMILDEVGGLSLGGVFVRAHASSLLDLHSSTRGFLPPRMATSQKTAIVTPAEGLVVYDSTLKKLSVFTGAVWETVTSA